MGGFGAFGKMPAAGDFLRLGVAGDFLLPWDAWLQQAMVEARAALGTRWQGCYHSAPIWRFTLAPGLAGPGAVLGVLMPSVDRVGRQFPLTLAAGYGAGVSPLDLHFSARGCFEALELVALDALEDSASADSLTRALDGVPVPAAPGPGRFQTGTGMLGLRTAPGQDPVPALAARAVERGYRAPSTWSATLDSGSLLMVCEGLPGPRRITALFDLEAPLWRMPPLPGDPA